MSQKINEQFAKHSGINFYGKLYVAILINKKYAHDCSNY